jgi:hypothetical protein
MLSVLVYTRDEEPSQLYSPIATEIPHSELV